jgi:hypothetical protein
MSRILYYIAHFFLKYANSTQGVLTTLISLISSSSASPGMLPLTLTPGIPEGATIATAALLLLLLLRDLIPVSKHWENAVKVSLNMGIIPLLFAFGAILLFKLVALF